MQGRFVPACTRTGHLRSLGLEHALHTFCRHYYLALIYSIFVSEEFVGQRHMLRIGEHGIYDSVVLVLVVLNRTHNTFAWYVVA